MGGGSSAPTKQNKNNNNIASGSRANGMQEKFDAAVNFSCDLVKTDTILKYASPDVLELRLDQSLPPTFSLFELFQKLRNLQKLNLSGNQLGPVAVRSLLLAMRNNSTITALLIADNQTDTDTAEHVGQMLKQNKTLQLLDLSGNYLGKDYFSRCVGPALAINQALQILKCESIGSTDLTVFGENLSKNQTLATLNINNNELSKSELFMKGLAAALTENACRLRVLEMKSCGFKPSDVSSLRAALASNSSLEVLDVSNSQVTDSGELLEFLAVCCKHPLLNTVLLEDFRVASPAAWSPSTPGVKVQSRLRCLSVSGCSLNDGHMTALLQHLGEGSMQQLEELMLSSNTDLTASSVEAVGKLTMSDASDVTPRHSSLKKLRFGGNNAENLASYLLPEVFPKFEYLNLRRAKASNDCLQKLMNLFKTSTTSTLVLDGIKLSGSGITKNLFDQQRLTLVALSMSNSQLDDSDVQPVFSACAAGTPLQMLKLADNRMTSTSVINLCDALEKSKVSPHPLTLVDLSNNQIDESGSNRFATALQKKKLKLQILNLASNHIAAAGLVSLMGCVNSTSLTSLNVSAQQVSYEEEDMKMICQALTKSLGMKVIENNDEIQLHTCDLPSLSPGFSVKLKGLGGFPSDLGKALDCSAVQTDKSTSHNCHLLLHHALEISASLKGLVSPPCVFSKEEFNGIISSDKDAPSWLQVSKQRDRAVYMTSLPAAITTQKLDGILENEADCSVEEVYLLKDLITRKNNGNAWVLLADEESVSRAVELHNRGQALVFSQPFTISRVQIKVDDEANSEAETKAKSDMDHRQQQQRQEASAHQQLIERSYHESQARHAYRLANPAYADGRIW